MEDVLDLSWEGFAWYAVVLLVASYVRGFSGFGFTAIFLTGLAFGLPVVEIVPLSIALELAASSGQARGVLPYIKWNELGILLATGMIFTPIGIYLLGHFDNEVLRIGLLVFVIVSSAYLLLSRGTSVRFSRRAYAFAGSVIGIVNGAAALSGLVLALFFSLSDERAAQMRATMIAYLFAADLWACSLLIGSGFYDSVTVARTVVSLPLLTLGVWLGSRHFASANPDSYRMTVLLLLLCLSTAGLVHSASKELF